MAITETRSLPAQFIEDLGKDYAKQLTAATAIPVDTSKFAPTVAGQDVLQQRAATLAGSGVGSFQPFIDQAKAQGNSCWSNSRRCWNYIKWYCWFNWSTNFNSNATVHVTLSITSN
jgi:hypothetical protein